MCVCEREEVGREGEEKGEPREGRERGKGRKRAKTGKREGISSFKELL